MRWIGAFILGNVLWFVLTFIAGALFSVTGLEYYSSWSNYYNLILYPLGLWLGFKVTKTPFLGSRGDGKTKDSQVVQGLLEVFYFPPPFPGVSYFPFENINDETRTKVLLFTYGVYDAYCQSSKVPNDAAQNIAIELDDFVQNALGVSFSEFLKTDAYKSAFDDPDLLKVIEIGGKTYGDFASKEKERGGQSVTRLRSLVDIWSSK
jgi:hypothetical protein